MKIISNHIETEAMNRRDLRAVYQCFLPLKPFISRILFQPFRERPADTLPHLPGCRFGKCSDQKSVHIHRMLCIRNQRKNPLYKNCCLAGTGCCRNQQIGISCINDLLLILRPCHTHDSSSSSFFHTSARSNGSRRRFSQPSRRLSNPQIL